MSNELTFATEAERLAARELYLAIDNVAWPDEQERSAERSDRAFPEIAPPKMVPWEGWAWVRPGGGACAWEVFAFRSIALAQASRHPNCRLAKVRVTEVE